MNGQLKKESQDFFKKTIEMVKNQEKFNKIKLNRYPKIKILQQPKNTYK